MSAPTPMLRKALDAVAVVAGLHLFALIALAVFTVQSGALTAEKAQHILAVMRDEAPVPEPGNTTDVAAAVPEDSPEPQNPMARSEMDKEILRREADRIKAELDQRLALNNSILLRVTTERERFRQEVTSETKARQERARQKSGEGYKKQLAILESLSPKVAADNLLAMQSIDEAASFLMDMQVGKAKKLIEAVKKGPNKDRMQTILQRVRRSPDGNALRSVMGDSP